MIGTLNMPGASLMDIKRVGTAITVRCPECDATFAFDMKELEEGRHAMLHHERGCKIWKKIRRLMKQRASNPEAFTSKYKVI